MSKAMSKLYEDTVNAMSEMKKSDKKETITEAFNAKKLIDQILDSLENLKRVTRPRGPLHKAVTVYDEGFKNDVNSIYAAIIDVYSKVEDLEMESSMAASSM